jgi:lipopolysaccharide assembly outer membrane protein LptD (OstA)
MPAASHIYNTNQLSASPTTQVYGSTGISVLLAGFAKKYYGGDHALLYQSHQRPS